MKVVVMGGTGFIGYHTVIELARRGHQLKLIARKRPEPGLWPFEVELVQANLEDCSEEEITRLLDGQEGLVYNLGADDRTAHVAPAYPALYQANVVQPRRIFELASRLGLKRGVLCGSYFTYFDRLWPEKKLAVDHPYIRSRKEQQKAVIQAAGSHMAVAVLELPYIFGSTPGRTPLWTPLIKYVKSSPAVFYTSGGTNMIAVEEVAQAICGALENVSESGAFPVGSVNMSWVEMFERFGSLVGKPGVRVVTIPNEISKVLTRGMAFTNKIRRQEPGLNPVKYLDFQASYSYIREEDIQASRERLKFERGDIHRAFEQTVKAALTR